MLTLKLLTNNKTESINLSILNDIDVSFDHTNIFLDSKQSTKKINLTPNPEHFQHKKQEKLKKKKEVKIELIDPYINENDINFKSYENVNIQKPRIPLSTNFHIPRDLRQKSLEMLAEKYKTIFDEKNSVIFAIETEIKINNEHRLKSAYWSKVKHVIKNIEVKK